MTNCNVSALFMWERIICERVDEIETIRGSIIFFFFGCLYVFFDMHV